ncbi:MAG: DUF2157 domain-containing protein [Clostridia bacterium]|nr:DUF2157 domain-containing protein [Clostridia bacterium]
MAKVSKNIKKLRTEKSMTQGELAEKINVTRQTVSSWENDRTQPGIDMLELLAEAFGTGIEEIIYGEKRNIGLEAPKPDRRKTMNIVFATLGSLLTATGLIIITIYIWDMIPDIFLALLSFLPLIVGGSVALWAYSKKRNSIGWSEGSSVAWVSGLVATLCLVVAMFGVDLDFHTVTIGLAVLILPIAFIMNSVFPLTVYFGITTFFVIEEAYSLTVFSAITGFLLFAVGLIFIFKQPRDDYRRKYSTWLAIISASIILLVFAEVTTDAGEAPTIFCMITGILTALYAADREENPAYPFRYISVPAISAIMCALCFESTDFIRGYRFYTGSPELRFPGIAPFISAIIIAVGVILGKKSFKNHPEKTAFIVFSSLTAALCAISATATEFFNDNGNIAINIIITLFSLAASIVIIISGIRKAKLLTVNFSLVMLCVLVYITIFAGRFEIIYSGIACIVMGAILLFLNYRMSKAFKAKEAEKNA